MWVGIDVGGRRKGFHVAVIADGAVTLSHHGGADAVGGLTTALVDAGPRMVGIDAPAAWAPPGQSSRPDERAFAAADVCGIRFTPDAATAAARTDGYYGWIDHGLELWAALTGAGLRCVEVFPTASWTRWLGPRADRSRAAWTGIGLEVVAGTLAGVRTAGNQDERDAVAAALTARAADRGDVDRFGTLVVPTTG